MSRTAKRPIPSGRVLPSEALAFGLTLSIGSVLVLGLVANLLAAAMLAFTIFFYAVVYSMWLKRWTPQNIVIGGAAGAFPPLVGWSAITGDLPPLALYLFAIIFVWTPVHFWALAILIKDDYAAAGVPMLPVVKGNRVTVIQIAVYTVATIITTFIPMFLKDVGWVYFASAVVLNLLLVRAVWRLWQNWEERPRASWLFHYSMLYLAILFLMFAVDRVIVL